MQINTSTIRLSGAATRRVRPSQWESWESNPVGWLGAGSTARPESISVYSPVLLDAAGTRRIGSVTSAGRAPSGTRRVLRIQSAHGSRQCNCQFNGNYSQKPRRRLATSGRAGGAARTCWSRRTGRAGLSNRRRALPPPSMRWPRPSCCYVRLACPASSSVLAVRARPEGRRCCLGALVSSPSSPSVGKGPRNAEGPGTFRFTGPFRNTIVVIVLGTGCGLAIELAADQATRDEDAFKSAADILGRGPHTAVRSTRLQRARIAGDCDAGAFRLPGAICAGGCHGGCLVCFD